jgi:hypothetical protein
MKWVGRGKSEKEQINRPEIDLKRKKTFDRHPFW